MGTVRGAAALKPCQSLPVCLVKSFIGKLQRKEVWWKLPSRRHVWTLNFSLGAASAWNDVRKSGSGCDGLLPIHHFNTTWRGCGHHGNLQHYSLVYHYRKYHSVGRVVWRTVGVVDENAANRWPAADLSVRVDALLRSLNCDVALLGHKLDIRLIIAINPLWAADSGGNGYNFQLMATWRGEILKYRLYL